MCNKKTLRVGILTIHAAFNFGSMLQAYALQNAVECCGDGDKTELIDYLPPCIMDGYSLNPFKNMGSPRSFLKYCVDIPNRVRRNRVFEEFAQDFFHTSPKQYQSNGELYRDRRNWDVCLLGSDQVWNPEIVKQDKAFWLAFADGYKASFASSFGTTSIPTEYLDALKQSLNGFDQIAVREPSARQMLSGVEKPIEVTCDPVFLLNAEEWAALERKPEGIPEHYMLLYTVERNEKLETLTQNTAAGYGIPVVDVGFRSNPRGYCGIHSPDFGPREFLYLIRHADYMTTNSFHGTAFATIFQRKCVSILHRSRGTRIRELAELSGRSRYILPGDASAEDVRNVFAGPEEDDYTALNERIAHSKVYLRQVLAQAREKHPGGSNGNN